MAYNTLASSESINATIANLATHNITGVMVNTKEDALAKIKEMIPSGASVMNGSSTTLEEIGYIDHLKSGEHPWNNLHEAIVKETDPAKQSSLRQSAAHADYYLGSVHAISETGDLVIASNTGSQLPNIVFTSKNLIFVVGTQKVVKNLEDGLKRLEEYVVPLEDKRSLAAYGAPTSVNKIVIFRGESPYMGRKVTVIIVGESLGY